MTITTIIQKFYLWRRERERCVQSVAVAEVIGYGVISGNLGCVKNNYYWILAIKARAQLPWAILHWAGKNGKERFDRPGRVVLLTLMLLASSLVTTTTAEGRQSHALHRLKEAKSEGRVEIIDPTSFFDSFGVSVKSTPSENQIVASPQSRKKEADKIERLPGQPDVDFDQYGGYVEVGEGRALFYYFVEAVGFMSKSKPLFLWLNGGPGCSSLGYGAMEELGPFRVNSDGQTFYRNRFSRNKFANVLFLESPVGVGYSYSNSSADYTSFGDRRTALDNYSFLVKWLERFPEYKDRDFYIAGESYAGNYVPELAHLILQNNKAPNRTLTINLKGVTVGNAVLNDVDDDRGLYDFFWSHALISDEIHRAINESCYPSRTPEDKKVCKDERNKAWALVDPPLDVYNIYAPLCNPNVTNKGHPKLGRFDPCSDLYVDNYLNLPSVQKAFHANVSGIIKYRWTACSDVLKWTDSAATVIPIIKEMALNGLRVWVYSGDVDGRVPVTSTRYYLRGLELPVTTEWYPWAFNKEVGGYTFQYQSNLTFATVRGAGHEVPSFQPARALYYIRHFLEGKALPLLILDDDE